MSAAPVASNNSLGLPQPQILTRRVEHFKAHLDKREFYIIKHDQNDTEFGRVHFYLEENITTPGEPPEDPKKQLEYRGKLPKDYENYPWNVIIIMTKKWLLVARPEPQQAELHVQSQAHYIWEQVEKLLKDDEKREEISTIICWVLYPDGEITTKIHDDKELLPVPSLLKIYGRVFGEGMWTKHWLKNRIIESRPYLLGKTPVNTQETNYRCQIVVCNLDTTFRNTCHFEQKTQDYEFYLESNYKALGFPLISLIAQVTCKGNDNTKAVVPDMANTRVALSMQAIEL